MTDPEKLALIGPFSSLRTGLSYISFGELLQSTRENGPGRYPIHNGHGETFHLVLYEDASWRISSPQLPIPFKQTLSEFETFIGHDEPHTLT
ncbi:hypothetical protein [robinz microvirus RP_171]|nr:hypothetical protein [robinz microvirus RP_171]